MSGGSLPARKDVKAALRSLGLSNRQVRALLASGWKGLVSESEAEAAELRDIISDLKAKL